MLVVISGLPLLRGIVGIVNPSTRHNANQDVSADIYNVRNKENDGLSVSSVSSWRKENVCAGNL